MKNLLLALVTFSVLLLIGCHENSITDPIQNMSLQKNDDPSINRGVISLEGTLEIPNQPNSFLNIYGQAGYIHELHYLDPIPPAPQQYVSLSLNVSADLTDPNSSIDPVWGITSKSEDVVYVSEEGISLLEKSYTIKGREDGLLLLCRYIVTTDGVGLNEMFLVLPENNSNR